MNILGIFYAVITVLAWGTWLAPSQKVPMKGQQTRTFYVTLAVMLLSLIVSIFVGFKGLNAATFWFPFLGGIIWSISGWSAFIGTNRLGMAKAFGIWAPLNIIVAIIWGVILFGEFMETELSALLLGLMALVLIIGGILMIIFADSGSKKGAGKKISAVGLLGAIGAGVGWATYFIPIQIGTANNPDFTMWVGMLPLSIGMFAGSVLLTLITKSSVRLNKGTHYARVMSTGVLWAIGNYGALAMMEIIGTGRGFTIAQLSVVVNALVGIYILRETDPKSKAAKLALLGVILAMIGGIILGNID
jgi:glucose uptake protein